MRIFLKCNQIVRWALLCTLFIPALAEAAPGDLDPAFGTNGSATIALGRGIHAPTGIAAQSDGKYLVSYFSPNLGPPPTTSGIVRFNADRTRDLTWGFKGVAGTGNEISGLVLSGEQVLAIENRGGVCCDGVSQSQEFPLNHVSRYTLEGKLDATFGGGPSTYSGAGQTVPFDAGVAGGTGLQRFNAITIAADGKIVVAGITSPFPTRLTLRRGAPFGCRAMARFLSYPVSFPWSIRHLRAGRRSSCASTPMAQSIPRMAPTVLPRPVLRAQRKAARWISMQPVARY